MDLVSQLLISTKNRWSSFDKYSSKYKSNKLNDSVFCKWNLSFKIITHIISITRSNCNRFVAMYNAFDIASNTQQPHRNPLNYGNHLWEKHETGEEYVTKKGKVVAARTVQYVKCHRHPGCNCCHYNFNCYNIFFKESRDVICTNYWALADYSQKGFLISHTTVLLLTTYYLLNLCKPITPHGKSITSEQFHMFYNELPTAKNVKDVVPFPTLGELDNDEEYWLHYFCNCLKIINIVLPLLI